MFSTYKTLRHVVNWHHPRTPKLTILKVDLINQAICAYASVILQSRFAARLCADESEHYDLRKHALRFVCIEKLLCMCVSMRE